jgi:hypothetical protein
MTGLQTELGIPSNSDQVWRRPTLPPLRRQLQIRKIGQNWLSFSMFFSIPRERPGGMSRIPRPQPSLLLIPASLYL